MHWSIQNKMIIVFSAVVLIVVLVSLTTYRNAFRLIDANRMVIHTHKVQEELEAILSLIKDAETGQRGFLLTGDTQYLEPYLSATGSLEQMLIHVQNLVADNPIQTEKANQLKSLITRKMQELEQTIQLRKKAGLPAAQEVVRRGSGKECMDQIRLVAGRMREIENDLLRKQIALVQQENSSTTFAIIIATLLNLVLLALGYFAITRHLRERRELETKIDQLNQRLNQRGGKRRFVAGESVI